MIANGVFHSKLVYMITVWGGAPQYLINALQVQQLRAARTVCGFQSMGWSRQRLLRKVSWLSVRQLIEYHTVLQAHKSITSGKPALLCESLSVRFAYQTRSATNRNINLNSGQLSTGSFKHRAMQTYNRIPCDLRIGTLQTVKQKIKQWVMKNIPLD